MKLGYLELIIKWRVFLIKKNKDCNTLWDMCFINLIKIYRTNKNWQSTDIQKLKQY